MNLETYQNHCLKLDELVSGDVEITICSRESIKTPDEKHHVKDWSPLAKTIIPRQRVQLVIEFLSNLQ